MIMMKKLWYLIPVLTFVFASMPTETATAQHVPAPVMNEEAKVMLDAAEARADQDEWTVAIAIVDAGGHLVAFRKLDGTQTGSVQFAVEKAKSAVMFKRPTKVFQDAVQSGENHMLGLTGGVPFEGGIPIVVDGEVIGAIGVSGVTAQQDGVVAQAGLDALDR